MLLDDYECWFLHNQTMSQTSLFFHVFLPSPSPICLLAFDPLPFFSLRYLQLSLQVGVDGGRPRMTQMSEGSASWRGIGRRLRAADRNANCGSVLWRRRPRSSALSTSRCRWVGGRGMKVCNTHQFTEVSVAEVKSRNRKSYTFFK